MYVLDTSKFYLNIIQILLPSDFPVFMLMLRMHQQSADLFGQKFSISKKRRRMDLLSVIKWWRYEESCPHDTFGK